MKSSTAADDVEQLHLCLADDNYLGRSGTVAVGRRVSDLVSSPAHAVRCWQARRRSQLMWAAADVIGLFSLNVVSFSNNVARAP